MELGHQKDCVGLHRLIQNHQKRRGRVEKDFVDHQKVVVEEMRNHNQKVVMNDFFVDHAAVEEELESSSIH